MARGGLVRLGMGEESGLVMGLKRLGDAASRFRLRRPVLPGIALGAYSEMGGRRILYLVRKPGHENLTREVLERFYFIALQFYKIFRRLSKVVTIIGLRYNIYRPIGVAPMRCNVSDLLLMWHLTENT